MLRFPKKLHHKLQKRLQSNALRSLPKTQHLIDFSSNDYLGFASNKTIHDYTLEYFSEQGIFKNGATGSRLLSGNHALYGKLETYLAQFHRSESVLVFNSGYDANIGFFSAIPQRGDVVFYDEYIHASIRDGIKMGNAKSYKFKHNNIEDLKAKYEAECSKGSQNTTFYIITESVFSMDGDSPDLKKLAEFCTKKSLYLIVDEAHAVGVFGENGIGLVQELGIEKQLFARILTFGKALGAHGAAILGNELLIQFLVNFARSFIYTTALSPHAIATIAAAYNYLSLPNGRQQAKLLQENITFFKQKLTSLKMKKYFIESNSAIHCCVIPDNSHVRSLSEELSREGYNVKAILAPTVPQGKERLRICLHSFNTKEEINGVLQVLKTYL